MRKRLAVVLATVLFITTLGLAAGQQTAAADNDCPQSMLYLNGAVATAQVEVCLLYTSPSPRDVEESRMPSSA